MMEQLHFHELQDIPGNNRLRLLVLHDATNTRSLRVVTDLLTAEQISMRLHPVARKYSSTQLPEVLLDVLGDTHFRIEFRDLLAGRYDVSLCHFDAKVEQEDGHAATLPSISEKHPIRLGDAILLHVINGTPIYAETSFLEPNPTETNTTSLDAQVCLTQFDNEDLHTLLNQMVEKEEYTLCARIAEELKRREQK